MGDGGKPDKPVPSSLARFNVGINLVDTKYSWDFLPTTEGYYYICVKNTALCLTPDYNKETQRVDVFIQEKNTNPETYWIEKLQQWKYDGKKLINQSLNWFEYLRHGDLVYDSAAL